MSSLRLRGGSNATVVCWRYGCVFAVVHSPTFGLSTTVREALSARRDGCFFARRLRGDSYATFIPKLTQRQETLRCFPRTITRKLCRSFFTKFPINDVRDRFARDVQLMITRENKRLLDRLLLFVLARILRFFLDLQMEKFLKNIERGVLLKNLFPKIRRRVTVRIRRIARSADCPGSVRTLVER